jgi:ATP-binding cassette subfamily B (MDR/TAP) protein 1
MSESATDEEKTNKSHKNEEKDPTAEDVKPTEPEIPPVSLAQLFQFHTRFEMTINLITLAAAAAAGAAMPLMSLIFGNLTQQFVEFQTILNQAGAGVPGSQEKIPSTAANFRKVAAQDAVYLVCIGVSHPTNSYFLLTTSRHWHVLVHVRLHVHLGMC